MAKKSVKKKTKQKKTAAHKAFGVNIQRASYFLDIHAESQPGVGAPSTPRRELPRGAIVFAVGALDAYMSEVSAEVIVRNLGNATATSDVRSAMNQVQRELPTIALEIAVLPDLATRQQRLREAIVEHFHTKVSMHGSKAVVKTAERIGAKPGDVWASVTTAGFSNPAATLDSWTNKRHAIVHEGKKPAVGRESARTCISLIKAIADAIDKEAAKQ